MIRFTEEHHDIRDMVAGFADHELAPRAAAADAGAEFPRASLTQLAELGILGLACPEAQGGAGAGLLTVTLVIEELGRCCASTALVTAAHVAEACVALTEYGTAAQQTAHLPGLAAGTTLGSLAIAERDAEIDVGASACSATRDSHGWVLNGGKRFVVGGAEAGLLLVVARTGAADSGTGGLSCFIVEGGARAQGVRVQGVEDMLGVRAAGVAELAFEDCRVPGAALLGDRENDFGPIARTLTAGRIAVAGLAAGLGRGATDHALTYAGQRRAFGRTINRFEALRNLFAEAHTACEAGRLLAYRAAVLREAGQDATAAASMAKLHACEAAYLATKSAVQVLGGNGFSREYPVERMYRDAKTLEVLGASAELHRRLVARALIGGAS